MAGSIALLFIMIAVSGCATDWLIHVNYHTPPPRETSGPELVVLPIIDRRGPRDDGGEPMLVGGTYNWGDTRGSKVMVARPWPGTLQSALVAGFLGEGIVARSGRQDAGFSLEAEVRDFSTEIRWYTFKAHIGAIVRLRAIDGRLLVEKKIEVRELGAKQGSPRERVESNLNVALERFVRAVTTDPDIRGQLK